MILDVTGRTIVIIGGGDVAARKARGLLDAGAGFVRCVAPEFSPQMPTEVQRVPETYHPSHLDGASIVFAATNQPSVNEQVVRDAHTRNLLVNRADVDSDQPGDFITPAVHRSGPIMIAVSAGNPTLAALVRDHLAEVCDPRWTQLAEAMRALRLLIKSSGLLIERRREIFHELATEEAMEILDRGGPSALNNWLFEHHPELGPVAKSSHA